MTIYQCIQNWVLFCKSIGIKKFILKRSSESFDFSPGVIGYPILFVLIIWVVFWVEIRFGLDFNNFGIRPRTGEGLRGILFSPFIHGDLKHLFNNSIPLLILSMALFYFYKNISWQVLLFGILLTGLLTWGIGRPSNHIGASGVIYLLASFLFFKGIFSKYYRLMALSFIVVFLYGGMLWFVVPVEPGISWEGHLSGLITGFLFALIYKQKFEKQPKYEWEKPGYKEDNDPFMKHFDENGNFIESLPEVEESIEVVVDKDTNESQKIVYQYFYKKSKEE
jgi:membrane associated rhomboid family serine protease